jgi:hypothetical protein
LVFANEKLVAVPNLGVQFDYQSSDGEEGYQIKWLKY